MAERLDLFVFGGENPDLHARIRSQVLLSRGRPYLQLFLDAVGSALCDAVSQLSVTERQRIKTFSTVGELNDSSRGGHCMPSIQFALTSVHQIGEYISHFSTCEGSRLKCNESGVIGISIGQLAAAAVALASDLPTLIPLGIDVVLISFRLGLYIERYAALTQLNAAQPWAIEVPRAAEMVHNLEFGDPNESSPRASRTYTSSKTSSSVTICGIPFALNKIVENPTLSSSERIYQPIYGPYHAPHLHNEIDPCLFFKPQRTKSLVGWESHCTVRPLVTANEEGYYEPGSDATYLLSSVISNILHKMNVLDDLANTCMDRFKITDQRDCRILPCGYFKSKDWFIGSIRVKTGSNIILQDAYDPAASVPAALNMKTARRSKLAIVGMAGRFPNAADHEKFWSLLEAGIDLHRKIPKDRFDVDKHFDPSGKTRNTSHTPFGCFIDEPGLFDPRFFNMSPREATQTDPMHRLGLTSAYEALEMAGYVPNRTPSTRLDRIGTFYGQTSDDWREINAAQDIDTYFITGGVRAFAPGRINYFFKFTGPSFSIDTACSSSAAAMQLACTSLWAKDCDTAVVGGLNVMTNSDIFAGLSRGQFLSKTGNCQTYDNDADGYCRGDGIGTIIVKRLEDAEADNDRILGLILETATNHSANAVSITHPHAETQQILFQKVMDDAGVDPHEVDYVEMHGTGTQAGDGTEMKSVTNVFAPASRTGSRRHTLHLGSVKANAGHGEAVSGVTAIIKSLMMLQKNLIPPHCGIKKTINQSFPQDLGTRNVHIAFKPTPFTAKDGQPRRIFVNNFSAAGGNTATLLEEAPAVNLTRSDPRGSWIVAVSGKSRSSFHANLRNLLDHLEKDREVRLPDLSYTTTARRMHHNYRLAVNCQSLKVGVEKLSSKLDTPIEPCPNVAPKLVFVYTGQGSHYNALSKHFYECSKHYRSDLAMFNNLCLQFGFPSFMPLINGEEQRTELSPLITQLGLVCIQMALTRLWASWGLRPNAVMGHSLGEYAALNAAGVLSAADTIFLVGKRASLLEKKCASGSHAMLATKSSTKTLESILPGCPGVEIACCNASQETVLAGTISDIHQAAEILSAQGAKCTRLNVQYAFHSTQVDPILADFKESTKGVLFHKPQVAIISPLLSTVLSETNEVDGDYLTRHAREPVNFVNALVAAQQLGYISEQTFFLELGPHPICSSFIKSEFGQGVAALSSMHRNQPPYESTCESLSTLHISGFAVDWNEFHKDFTDCARLVDLPAYAFDNKNYWIQYTGDWNLQKGQVMGLAALPGPEVPKISTTTVQRLVSEVVDSDKAVVVIESDVSQPELLAAISGHQVNATSLCPSSIYADMAITVGEYIHRLLKPSVETLTPNVCNMEVFKPFIANDDGGKGQMIRLTATLNGESGKANLTFTSGSGKSELQHAKCQIEYGTGSTWLSEWQRSAYLIAGRVEGLKKAATSGGAHRMLRGMAYKLFGAFVEYDSKFRGMEEVILDSAHLEGTASIAFQTETSDGNFVCSPFWIDSVCHLAGFIMNANDAVDSNKEVYVSHGWESMRFGEPLQRDKTYRSYVKMQPLPGNMVAGDVYIFDDDRIIGMCGALKFQCIPRSLLNTFLPPKNNPSKPSVTAAANSQKPHLPNKLKIKPKSQPSPQKLPKLARSDPVVQIMEIIAAEIGMPAGELADPIVFSDIGVDSLMSLSISGRIREELDLDCTSSVFVDYPTIGELKRHLGQIYPLQYPQEPSISSEDSDTTSESDASSQRHKDLGTPISPPGSPGEPSDAESLSMIVRQTICEQMEVEMSELLSTKDLTLIGMDSLMTLSILGTLREKVGLNLPQDFLADNPNIKAIEKALHIEDTPPPPPPPQKAKSKTNSKSSETNPPPQLQPAPLPQIQVPVARSRRPPPPDRKATSILLQGSPKTATKVLWLVPDGGGAPTSYTFLDAISPTVTIWGLTSPFLKTPEEFICGVVGIATKYVVEIKRRQPAGPYSLGGWSAGGVISYEICRQLLAQGDQIDTLLLIDTPCPLIIEPLPGSLHRFFATIGLLGEGDGVLEKLPQWLLPHFAASVHALSTYDPVPLHPAAACPKVWAMWCEDGVCKNPEDPKPEPYPYGHAQFLLENRSDFGPGLWDEFVDGAKLVTKHMPGNHFSMMKPPYSGQLSDFIRDALQ